MVVSKTPTFFIPTLINGQVRQDRGPFRERLSRSHLSQLTNHSSRILQIHRSLGDPAIWAPKRLSLIEPISIQVPPLPRAT